MAIFVEAQESCALAWLAAVEAVDKKPGHEAHNVMIEIANPLRWTDQDRDQVEIVDTFLTGHGGWPVLTVANTIFPESLYRRYVSNPALFYAEYRKILSKMSRGSSNWGRYFGRLIEHRTMDGRTINPLEDHVIRRFQRYVHGDGKTQRNIYEIRVFDPDMDISIYDPGREPERPVGGRPCLSFLSFKLDGDNRLLLTAIYRNHYYIQRLLGNLIGLSQLMAYVAERANLEIDSLTIVSTHAQIDTGGQKGNWRRGDIFNLLKQCRELHSEAA